ncbi:MAG: long-chain fatty acid--CoA ligase [Nitriliruptorales bacterium]|nr:long-chain fatty acid--CoA ligase [Nitriliruptorales bacterium]
MTILTPPTDDRGTLVDLFLRNVEQVPDVGAIVDGDTRLTWGQYGQRSAAVALALRDLGVTHGDVVGLHMINRHEHTLTDTAALRAGATPTSFYNTLAPEQLTYVAGDCKAKVVVCDADKLDTWLKIRDDLPALEHLIVHDLDEVPDGVTRWADFEAAGQAAFEKEGTAKLDKLTAKVKPTDIATIIYTSGTTGPPKGVQLTHEGLRFNISGVEPLLERGVLALRNPKLADWIVDGEVHVPPGIPGISYLPLAHVAERFNSHYNGAFNYASEITYVRDLLTLPEALPRVRPILFVAVPRVWEKFYGGIVAKLEEEPNERKRGLGLKALEVAADKGRAISEGRRADLKTEALHFLFERLVYSKIREGIGLDRCAMGFSGAAPIQNQLLWFFTGIGVPISEVYGMTESSTLITVTPPGRPRVGTVGVPLEGSEVKIADDGEVLFKGPHMTPGYLNRPEATAEAIDDEGWFHTGDLGEFDEAGYLKIIGRKKELIITAAGKNLSPNNIEEEVKSASPIISQVCAIGDERKFISALIVLDPDALPAWCKAEGIPFETFAQASQEPKVHEAVQLAVDQANQKLARVEQVKKFTIMDREWTPLDPEMTPSMKLRRSVIHEIHKDVIDAMYADA